MGLLLGNGLSLLKENGGALRVFIHAVLYLNGKPGIATYSRLWPRVSTANSYSFLASLRDSSFCGEHVRKMIDAGWRNGFRDGISAAGRANSRAFP